VRYLSKNKAFHILPLVVEISSVVTTRYIQIMFLNYDPQEIYVTMFLARRMRPELKQKNMSSF